VEAWEWHENDKILNILPLHHIHGIVNVVACSLWTGASLEMMKGKFDPIEVWKRLLRDEDPLNVFMAVPTIYSNLTKVYDEGKVEQATGLTKDQI